MTGKVAKQGLTSKQEFGALKRKLQSESDQDDDDDELDEEDVNFHENPNYSRKIEFDAGTFSDKTVQATISNVVNLVAFFDSQNERRKIEDIPPKELDELLVNFYTNGKRRNGEDFKWQTLQAINASLHRYLAPKKYYIVQNPEFASSQSVLKSSIENLRKIELLNTTRRVYSLTVPEIQVLWDMELLGTHTERSLLNTMLFINTRYFYIRGNIPHSSLLWGDVELLKNDNGEECLQYNGRLNKCKDRNTRMMLCAQHNERCPVVMYKAYAAQRPASAQSGNSRFYLQARKHEVDVKNEPSSPIPISDVEDEEDVDDDEDFDTFLIPNYENPYSALKKIEFEPDVYTDKTVKYTIAHVSMLVEFFALQNEHRSLTDIPPKTLNELLVNFYKNGKKRNGEELQWQSLKTITSSLQRYLAQKNYNYNIRNSPEFQLARDALKSARRRKSATYTIRRKHSFSDLEIHALWHNKLLGAHNERSLLNTMFFINTHYFGITGKISHSTLLWGDIKLLKLESGGECLQYNNRLNKFQKGPKILYAQNRDSRCPVAMYKTYTDQRPTAALRADSRFYIQINTAPGCATWYKNAPLGHNSIGKISQDIMAAAEAAALDHQQTLPIPISDAVLQTYYVLQNK